MHNAQCTMLNAQCRIRRTITASHNLTMHSAQCAIRTITANQNALLLDYYCITANHNPATPTYYCVFFSSLLCSIKLSMQLCFHAIMFYGILLYSCAIFCPLIMSVLYFNCKATLGTAAFHNAHYHIFYNTTICWVRQTLPHHSVPQNMV